MRTALVAPARSALPSRVARWVCIGWSRLTWRHVVLAAVLSVAWSAVGPVGGAWLFPFERKEDLIASFLGCGWAGRQFVLVWFALVADAAFDDGVPAWLAYSGAALAATLLSAEVDRQFAHFVLGYAAPRFNRFWVLQVLSQGSLGLAMYAYWRVGQKSLEQTHAVETERLRMRQRLEASTLRALQARVDPQLLFDALDRIECLHETDSAAADRLLGDLIALLRAMLPQDERAHSTVAEEMAMVEAWLLVRRQVADGLPEVRLHTRGIVHAEPMTPMLVLPLLRAVLSCADTTSRWTLSVARDGDRLRIDLTSDGPPTDTPPELGGLRERLLSLHGETARLLFEADACAWTLELPVLSRDIVARDPA